MRKRLLSNYLYLILLSTIILSSCETEGVSRISFDNNSFALRVGQSDTLVSTISFTGDVSKFPVEWTVQNPEIISIVETTDDTHSKTSGTSSVTKSVIITALKAGSTALTINAGGKTHSCQVTVTQQSLTFNQAFASNWGDYYETGTNNFDIYLFESTLSINGNGEVEGNGNMMYLEFYLPLTQSTLANGSFTLSNDGAINTFYPGEVYEENGQYYVFGSTLTNYNGENSTMSLITDGNYTITKSGNNFVIEGELVLNESEVIAFTYNGIVIEQDMREEPVEINPTLTKGILINYGDAYQSGTTNNFVAYLGSADVSFDAETWDGDVLMLEFNSALNVTNHIPDGTYQMMTELSYEQLTPFSLVFGYTDNNQNEWGTWYYGQSGELIKKINAGNMTVSKVDNNYTIQYELYDRFGSKVWGTYSGPLAYIDATQESPAAAPSKIKGVKSLKNPINKKFMQINKHISRTRRQVELLRR